MNKYRVIFHRAPTPEHEDYFAIHGVMYDSTGKPTDVSVEPYQSQGANLEELREDIQRKLDALNEPVLDYDQF